MCLKQHEAIKLTWIRPDCPGIIRQAKMLCITVHSPVQAIYIVPMREATVTSTWTGHTALRWWE